MISFFITSILILLFFLLGYIPQAFKKLISLIVKSFLHILNFFGITLRSQERQILCSDEFKKAYKEIKRVKWSNKNIHSQSSIDWLSLIAVIICLILIISNLKIISDNIISNWLSEIFFSVGIAIDPVNMNTFYTAVLFSVISFSLSRLWSRWKTTKKDRIQRKQLKIKQKAIKLMTSKELIDAVNLKDKEKYEEIKK